MLKLIKYLWYRYILREGFNIITDYKVDIGTVIKFDSTRQKSIILWVGKKDVMGCINHYLLPIEEAKEAVLAEYFVNKLLIHKHGVWH